MRFHSSEVCITAGTTKLNGRLNMPPGVSGAVILVSDNSGQALFQAGFATLTISLLTPEEQTLDLWTRKLRFNVELLSARLERVVEWMKDNKRTRKLNIGLMAAHTGAAVAMTAAAHLPDSIGAVVSRSGRPDLAADILPKITAPTLLIAGGNDPAGISLNRFALSQLQAPKALEVVPSASYLFEESGTLQVATRLARDWFQQHLAEVAQPVKG